MMSEVLICFEYQILSENDFVHRSDFTYLLELALPCFEGCLYQGKAALKIKQYLATIGLPSGMVLEILPKISGDDYLLAAQPKSAHRLIEQTRHWVLDMLQTLQQHAALTRSPLPALTQSAIDVTKLDACNNSTWQDMLHAFIQPWHYLAASRAIEQGLECVPHHYQTRSHNRPQAMGKLRLSAQLKHNAHRPHYFFGECHRLNAIGELQTVLHAAKQLALEQAGVGLSYMSAAHKQPSQSYLLSFMGQAHQQTIDKWYHRLVISKDTFALNAQLSPWQQSVLRQALAWAKWLMCDNIPPPLTLPCEQPVSLPNPATLINMNLAFETWVSICVTDWAALHLPEHKVLTQPDFDWLTVVTPNSDRIVAQRLSPDICIQHPSGQITCVIDVKYKRIKRIQDVSAADWQQIYTYQALTAAKQAWLIYPKSAGFTAVQTVSDNTRLLQAVPFDVQTGALLLT